MISTELLNIFSIMLFFYHFAKAKQQLHGIFFVIVDKWSIFAHLFDYLDGLFLVFIQLYHQALLPILP